MSDDFDGTEDAKAAIRAAVQYLLKESSASDRGDILREIVEIVSEVARGLAPGGAGT
jgi:acyl-CoA reductase-like NAD-dependent aldehyde dehydrogenase